MGIPGFREVAFRFLEGLDRTSFKKVGKRVDKYAEYRHNAMLLSAKIFQFASGENLLRHLPNQAKIPEAVRNTDMEDLYVHVLYEYVIFEHREKDKRVLDWYMKKNQPENEWEQILLEAFRSSDTSLYEVVSASANEVTATLRDILGEGGDVVVTDFGLSHTASIGTLLFARIIHLPWLNATSGLSLPFFPESRDILLREYRKRKSKPASLDESARRFLAFLRLYEEIGAPYTSFRIEGE